MSRIGKQPIIIPDKVKVSLADGLVLVEGPKGKLKEAVRPGVKVAIDGKTITVTRDSDEQNTVAMHGMMRAKINNMVEGVVSGFEKRLEIQGVGFKALPKGKDIELNLGFSHSILVKAPVGIKFELDEKGVKIKVSGPDRCLVGQIAADIRQLKLPEPYKGKGVRYQGEYVRHKAGKAAVATTAA